MCKCAVCCSAQVAKCLLGLINSIIITVGVLLAIIGALLHFGGNFVYQLLSQALSSISSSSVGSSVKTSISITDLQQILGTWSVYISYAGIALLAVGAFLVALGIIGSVGACCNLKVLLIIYIVVMGVFALACAGLAVGYIVNKSQVREVGATEMLKLLQDKYKGRASPDEFTNILDLVQSRVPCCGVENYTDFESATNWNRTYQLSNGSFIVPVTPVSCCKITASTFTPVDETCTFAPNSTNSNFMSGGCYAQLWGAFDTFSNSATYGLFITAAVTGIIAGLAVIIVINASQD